VKAPRGYTALVTGATHDDSAAHRLLAGQLWLARGWQTDAVSAWARMRRFARIDDRCRPASARPWVLPGMPNLHSHAFQRAMAGLAERKGRVDDSFWSWRETMYAFAAAIDPDELKAIATQLYVEMLKAGYTQVCEFHYLHHQPGRQRVCAARGDVAGADRGGARSRHRADPVAGAVHERWLRRSRADPTAAPLRSRRGRLFAPAGSAAPA
jgi:cytosine/adenosine deaminase-related metal-dependent hydrolase